MIAMAGARLFTWRNATLLLVLLGMGFMVSRLDPTEYRDLLQRNLLILLPAMLLISMAVVGWGLNWSLVLRGLGAKAGLSRSLSVFLYTWLGRYVPGTVPYHASRILAAESLGTDKTKVGASIAYETVLMLGSGALLGCLGVLLGLGAGRGSLVYLLAAVPLASLPFALQPRVLVPLANRALRVAGRPDIGHDSFLTGRQTAASFLGYAGVHVVNGLSFVLVLMALNDGSVNPALAIGAYTLGGIAGAAAIFVPSGIGVREGVIVGLLSGVMAPEEALLAAAAARAISIVADLLPIGVVVVLTMTGHALRAAGSRRQALVGPPQGHSPL
jgi:glycosyltransferase 2 family protein